MSLSIDQTPARAVVMLAVDGDRAAFTELVAAHDTDILRLCCVITGDPVAAREVVQDAWLKAWSRKSDLRDPGRFLPWVVAIACNGARGYRRTRLRLAAREGSMDEASAMHAKVGSSDPDLSAALGRMSEEDRQILALKFVMGWSSAEIGRALSLSPTGARVRLYRAVSRLRKELA